MKKILAVITVFAMLFAFAACRNGDRPVGTTAPAESTAGQSDATENVTTATQSAEENTAEITDTDVTTATDESGETVTAEEETDPSLTVVSKPSANPSEWTTQEIVEFYKRAAAKSSHVTSSQTMEMTEIVANDGNGFLGTFIEWVTPIFKAALKKNSTENQGITGGYDKLTAADVQSAKAYKSGEYTVIEMTMKEQTDGINGVWSEGTVGHAISVVGDISVVRDELPQFYIDFENADIKLHYTKPRVKVKINKDGVIEKGTWSYVLDVELENLYIEALRLPIKVTVESGYGSVDYKVTVGGGF